MERVKDALERCFWALATVVLILASVITFAVMWAAQELRSLISSTRGTKK